MIPVDYSSEDLSLSLSLNLESNVKHGPLVHVFISKPYTLTPLNEREEEKEEVCALKCLISINVTRSQDFSEPTYTEASSIGKTQPVSIFGHRNWANLRFGFY